MEPLTEVVFTGTRYNSRYRGSEITLDSNDTGKTIQLPVGKAKQVLQDFPEKFVKPEAVEADLPAHAPEEAVKTFEPDREEELRGMTIPELREIADGYDLKKVYDKGKTELVPLILKAEAGTEPETEAVEAPEETTDTSRYDELDDKNVTVLRDYAKDLEMTGYYQYNKDTLIKAIIDEE